VSSNTTKSLTKRLLFDSFPPCPLRFLAGRLNKPYLPVRAISLVGHELVKL
jgi:hypothetical protein